MAPSGLRVTQFSLLRTLCARRHRAHRPTSRGTLLLDRTALSRKLDPLVERGLVAIAPGSDARTREVSLTRAGAKARPRRRTALASARRRRSRTRSARAGSTR